MPEGRALRVGKLPTIPALHWAITRSGVEMINSGAPITGRRKFLNKAGRGIEILKPAASPNAHIAFRAYWTASRGDEENPAKRNCASGARR